jgi:O-antigen/teichoic acid export membrane protein
MGLARTTLLYFTPIVVSLLISVIMVPVTTAVLGAEEIGRLALLTAFGGIVVAVTTAPSNYIWAAHLFGVGEDEKPGFVTTIVACGAVLTVFVMAVTYLLWYLLRGRISYFAETSAVEIALLIGMAGALAYWNHIHPFLILETRARWIAVVSITGAIAAAVITTLGLFVWEMGIQGVLLGSLVGALVSALGGLAGAIPHLRLTWSWRWCWEFIQVSLLRTPQHLFDPLASMAERWMVTNWVSLAALGIYSHSQSYRTTLASALGALNKSLMPVSLREARQGSRDFPQTRAGLHFAVFMLTLASMGFAVIGKEWVGLLTHGKFAAAAPFVSCWLIHATLGFTVREDMAILQTANCKGYLTVVSLFTQLANLIALFFLIPLWGTWGVFTAIMTEVALNRLLFRWKATHVHPTQFADGPVIVSFLWSLAALAVQSLFWDNIVMRATLVTCLLFGYLVIEGTYVRELYWRARRKLVSFWGYRFGLLARPASSPVTGRDAA